MRGKAISICVLLLTVFSTISLSIAYKTISCNSPINKNGKISVNESVIKVDVYRNDLQVYKYNNTKSVNILIHDVDIVLSDPLNPKSSSSFRTALEGLAKLTSKNTLDSCDFDLKLKKWNRKNSTITNYDKLLAAESCIESSLCKQLGNIVQEDYLRAKIDPHDFGENSVLYHQLNEKFPNLNLPTKSNDELDFRAYKPETLQKTLNIVFDVLIASLVRAASGKELGIIDIPAVQQTIAGNKICKDGSFKIKSATFGDLKNIIRTENFDISNDGLHFAIKFALQIPHAILHLNDYNVQYCILNKSGNATLGVDSIIVGVQIDIDFNQSPCRTSTKYVRTKIEGIHFKLTGGYLDTAITKVMSFVIDQFTSNIVDLVKIKLKEAINAPLQQFECEKYRP